MSFDPLAHHPLRGWPIRKDDLDPYAAEADEILELPGAGEDLPLAQAVERFRRVEFRQSPPTRFGDRYEAEIAADPNILCATNANLVDLRLDEEGLRTVTEAVFRSFDPADPGFSVRARAFCLCLGGLENPRLLLNCSSQKPAGIGNDHDMVGRYFCDHPHFHTGDVFFERPIPEAALPGPGGVCFVPTRDFMDRNEVLSFAMIVYPFVEDELHLGKELARAASCVTPSATAIAARLTGRKIDCDQGGLRNYMLQDGGRHSVFGTIRIRSEQSLIRDSRVMLAETRDPFGHRRILLDWRLGDIDYETLRLSVLELGAHYAEQGTGRVRVVDWVLENQNTLPPRNPGQTVGGPHHMCTTRMSADPRDGVVDADCRVHGMSNLYIGGSSAFASPGYANPTYTIVQLSLRLSDHLGQELNA